MFFSFTSHYNNNSNLHKGYRLIACDGSDISIAYNPDDAETYFQNGSNKGFNQFHLNVVVTKCTKKYVYQLNYTFAIHICRYFISKMAEKSPPDVEALISKEILPVRPGRYDPCKVTPKKAASFLYRIA